MIHQGEALKASIRKAALSQQDAADALGVSRQCRHHDISMTQRYLKSLGFVQNDSFGN